MLHMKHLLLFPCALALLAATGCLVAEGGRPGRSGYHSHPVVIVPAPVVVAPAPVIVVPAVRIRVD